MDEKEFKLTVIGHVPSKPNSYKVGVIAGHGTIVKTKRLKEYENIFISQCVGRRSKANPLISGFFEIELSIFLPNKIQDLDNCLKIILDCLQLCGIVKNDNKCLRIVAERYYDKQNPRVDIHVREVFKS